MNRPPYSTKFLEGPPGSNTPWRYDAHSAEAGLLLDYATPHQFVTEQGEFGLTSRGGPIPWGDIPARPFLGWSDDLDAEITGAVERHFTDALRC